MRINFILSFFSIKYIQGVHTYMKNIMSHTKNAHKAAHTLVSSFFFVVNVEWNVCIRYIRIRYILSRGKAHRAGSTQQKYTVYIILYGIYTIRGGGGPDSLFFCFVDRAGSKHSGVWYDVIHLLLFHLNVALGPHCSQ